MPTWALDIPGEIGWGAIATSAGLTVLHLSFLQPMTLAVSINRKNKRDSERDRQQATLRLLRGDRVISGGNDERSRSGILGIFPPLTSVSQFKWVAFGSNLKQSVTVQQSRLKKKRVVEAGLGLQSCLFWKIRKVWIFYVKTASKTLAI